MAFPIMSPDCPASACSGQHERPGESEIGGQRGHLGVHPRGLTSSHPRRLSFARQTPTPSPLGQNLRGRFLLLPLLLPFLLSLMGLLLVSAGQSAEGNENDRQLTRILQEGETSLYLWESTCNSYVLQRGDRAIVIDPGDGSLLARLPQQGIEHLDWILFTSHHRERSQGFPLFDRQQTQLAASTIERELFEDPVSFRRWYPSLGDKYSVYGASYVRPPRLPIPLDRSLEDDQRLEWSGLEIHALLTPGNSPGGMTYMVRIGERKVAFSGGIMHAGARMVTWFDTEWDYGFAKGIDVLQESVARLIETEIDLLLPAHGPSVENPRDQLTTYREKLAGFRASYLRGYPVFDLPRKDRDPVSRPTAVPGLSQVTPHLYKLSDSEKGWNFAIIISDEGRGLILDCGLLPREMLEELIIGMRQHLGLKQIDAFWISHMHGDHFLLGPLLREKYGAQSWTLDRVVDPIENPRRYDYAALVSAYGDGFDGMPIDKAFEDGESIEWEGYRIQVDWMPGQTEFGCSLWLELDGQRIVFTGDNLFGNPADPDQDGHEAVVARNSCIFEEGYLHAAKYLLELDPDLIMGSHSFVMPNPRSFLQRYYNWAREIIAIYQELLPETHYEYRFDPYWVSAYPYRVALADAEVKPVGITVRNFRDRPQRHRIVIRTPPGIQAEPSVLEGTVGPNARETFSITIRANLDEAEPGVGIVALDITLDDQRYGEWFDFLTRVGPAETPKEAAP